MTTTSNSLFKRLCLAILVVGFSLSILVFALAHQASAKDNQAGFDGLLGTWQITPYYIVNRQECGPVRYQATLEITRQVNETHYVGTTYFNWDTSRLAPGCNFRAATRGSLLVDVYVDGGKITLRYRNTGANNYADDHLTLADDVMAGVDLAGQRIVYSKI